MANMTPDYRDATELIKNYFRAQSDDIKRVLEDLKYDIGELVYAAYLQGTEEGFTEGQSVGYEEGREEGNMNGYEEGYDDARAEFDDEW